MEEQVGTGTGIAVAVVIWVVFGAVCGWIASMVVKGTGLGLGKDSCSALSAPSSCCLRSN